MLKLRVNILTCQTHLYCQKQKPCRIQFIMKSTDHFCSNLTLLSLSVFNIPEGRPWHLLTFCCFTPLLSTRLLLTYSTRFNLWPKCLSLICVIGAEHCAPSLVVLKKLRCVCLGFLGSWRRSGAPVVVGMLSLPALLLFADI